MNIQRKVVLQSLLPSFRRSFCYDIHDSPFDLPKHGPDIFEDYIFVQDNDIFSLDRNMIPQPLRIIRQNKQLQALKVQKNIEQLESYFEKIEYPNSYSYNIMIDHYLSQNNLQKAKFLLEQMDVPNAVTFSCFAKYHLHANDYKKSLDSLKQTLAHDHPNLQINALIVRYVLTTVKNNCIEQTKALFQYLQQKSVVLKLDHYIQIAKSLQKYQLSSLHLLLEAHYPFDFFKAAFLVLIQRDHFDLATQILNQMKEKGLAPDHHMIKALIHENYKRKHFQSMIDIYESMETASQQNLTIPTKNIILKAYGECHKIKKFISHYESIDKKTIQTYNTALRVFGKQRWFTRVNAIVEEMDHKQIEFSLFTYHILAYFYGIQGEPEWIQALMERMRSNDIIPDHLIYQGLIMAFGKQKKYYQVLETLERMDQENVYISKQIYGQIIDLFSFYDQTQFHRMVNRLVESDIALDENNYISIIEGYYKFGLYQEAENYHLLMKNKFKMIENEKKINQIMTKV